MNKPLKVLFFIDRLRLGGIQILAKDILLHNDRNRMIIDILNLDDGIDYPLKKEIEGMGVRVFQLKGIWLHTPLDFFAYWKAVDKFFEQHRDYDVLHVHSGPKNSFILKAAKKWGILVRVAHSHNTGFQSKNPMSIMLGNLLKGPMKRYATHVVGCSKMACEWMFGKGCVERGEAKIILNAINCDLFIYKENVRNEVRKELGLENKFVLGHVGRFETQKNHSFLLDIFAEVSKKRDDACLVLIGIGSLMDRMKRKAEALGIADKVMFLGFRSDRERIMQAMDTFVFPSLHEGLSVVLIEAQASGMPVFVSDTTTTEVSYSPYIKFLSLGQSAEIWAEEIVSCGSVKRKNMKDEIKKTGFEIHEMIDNLYRLYTTL
ncbi:MAG: glycosyltransferase family 1 protein [Prevotellaceae bacterium]|nr:glycosyltransferase family 1 protein [Prevotellaceae bacterium]